MVRIFLFMYNHGCAKLKLFQVHCVQFEMHEQSFPPFYEGGESNGFLGGMETSSLEVDIAHFTMVECLFYILYLGSTKMHTLYIPNTTPPKIFPKLNQIL